MKKQKTAFACIALLAACALLSSCQSYVKLEDKAKTIVTNSSSEAVTNVPKVQDQNEQLHKLGEPVDFKFYDFVHPDGPSGKDHPHWEQQYTVTKAVVYSSLQEAGLTAADLLDLGYTPNGIDDQGNFKTGFKLLIVDMTEKNILPSETTPDPPDKCPIGAGIYRGIKAPLQAAMEVVYLPDSLAKETGKEKEDTYAIRIPVGESRSFRAGWMLNTTVKGNPEDDGIYLCVMTGTNDELKQWVDLGVK